MLSCLTEFNEEVFRKGIHEEGYAEGRAEAREEDLIKAIHMLKDVNVSKEISMQQLMDKYKLSETEVVELIDKYWE